MIIGDGGHAKVVKSFHQDFVHGSIIAIGDNHARRKEAESRKGWYFGVAIHVSAIVSHDVEIGEGTVIMAGVIVQPGTKIGKHVILNTGSQVDHHCIIHDYAHVSPNATICGAVEVGEGAQVGAGAVCVQGASVEPWTLVKAGSVHKSADWRERCKSLCGPTK